MPHVFRVLRWPLGLVAGFVAFYVLGTSISLAQVEGGAAWVRGAGVVGAMAYAGVYSVGSILALPASWFQGGAGFLWGPVFGPLYAWIASTAFGTLNFLLARTVLRGFVERRISRWPRFAALDRAVGEDGLGLVILLRLSPLSPYSPVSYALGITRIRLRHYLLGTLIGSAPAVLVWSTVGASLDVFAALLDGRATVSGGPWVAAVALTIGASVGLALYARRALASRQEQVAPAA